MTDRFATLTFAREVAASVPVLWQAWTAPAARAVWASPAPSVTVKFPEADARVGGREVSLCKATGAPDIRCEGGWLDLRPDWRRVRACSRRNFPKLVGYDSWGVDVSDRVRRPCLAVPVPAI